MAENQHRQNPRNRRRYPATIRLSFDGLVADASGNFSTTLYVNVSGDWPGGWPSTTDVVIKIPGAPQDISLLLDFQSGEANHVLTGLRAGHHIAVHASATAGAVSKATQALIEIPKPKSVEQMELERVRFESELAEAQVQLRGTEAKLEPPKVRPTHLKVEKHEHDTGKYTLTITALSHKDGNGACVGVPGVDVTVSEYTGKRYRSITDTKGTCSFPFEVQGRSKHLTISVDGTGITETTKLLGPPSRPN